jgi:hypothetical protein
MRIFAITNLDKLSMTLQPFPPRPDREKFLVAQQKTCD